MSETAQAIIAFSLLALFCAYDLWAGRRDEEWIRRTFGPDEQKK